jgi:hypothetical protein
MSLNDPGREKKNLRALIIILNTLGREKIELKGIGLLNALDREKIEFKGIEQASRCP